MICYHCRRVRAAGTAAYELPARPEDDKGEPFLCNVHRKKASPDCLLGIVLLNGSTDRLCAAGASFIRTTVPLALSLALCNMDRIVLSVAIVPIAREFGFSIAAQVNLRDSACAPCHSLQLLCVLVQSLHNVALTR